MAILWITEHYYPNQGGMAQSCDRIVAGLRELGLCIDVIHLAKSCRRRTLGNPEQGEDRCWPLGDNPSHGLNLLWNWLEQNDANKKYQKIVAYGTHYALVSAQNFSAYFDLPLYSFVRGNDFDSAVFDSKRRTLIESLYHASETVFCVSKDKQRKISKLFKGVNSTWVANGIDLSQWQVMPSHKKSLAKIKANFPVAKKVIGLFGHIKDKKGGVLLLETIKLANLTEQLHLLIVGELDPPTQAILDIIDANISYTLLPFTERNQLIPYYLSCDCIAIPSFYDGMPNVMLEASALGVPILCTKVGGMDDILTHAETAIMFEPGDKSVLHQLLEFVAFSDGKQLTELGKNAQQLITEQYQAKAEALAYYNKLGN